jgi:hypothetical protein
VKPSDAEAFGPQAECCRRSACVACSYLRETQRGRTIPHHTKTRRTGGRDDVTLPLCEQHHVEIHTEGRWSFWRDRWIPLSVVQQALDSVRRGAPWHGEAWEALPW